MPKDFDCIIAEKIFEWKWWKSSVTGRRRLFAPGEIPRGDHEWFKEKADGSEDLVGDWNRIEIPPYSSDIQAAWQVVEWLRASSWLVTVKEMPDGFPFIAGNCAVTDPKIHARSICELMYMPLGKPEEVTKRIYCHPHGIGDCAAMAICRAALNMIDLTSGYK